MLTSLLSARHSYAISLVAALPITGGSNALVIQGAAAALPFGATCSPKVRRGSRPRHWQAALTGLAMMAGLMLGSPGNMEAQTAHFAGTQSVPFRSGLSQPQGVAVDRSGNVYIVDSGNGRVLKETLASGVYTESTVVSGLSQPQGVAVDTIGNVYIADTGNSRVLKETPSGGAYTESTVASGLNQAEGVAVDGSGNLYIADPRNYRVLKETPTGSVYAESTVGGNGLFQPYGVAVDGSGNLYISDTSNGQVLKETLSGGIYAESTVASGLNSPYALAVDGNGNVYIADTGHGRVLKVTLSGGVYTQSTVENGLSYPQGVAVDGSGSVYIADTYNNRIVEVIAASPSFGSILVGSTSGTQTEIFSFDTGGTIAAPPVLTQGATGLDFNDAGSGSCTTNGTSHAYAARDTCTVDVKFSPKFAGARYGAVQLTDSSGAVIATTYLQGTGTGPQAVFYPGMQSVTFSTGLARPTGVVVDGSGNIYIADHDHTRVLKEALSDGVYAESTVGSGLFLPQGLVVDGSGNVYIADADNNRVLKETLSGGVYIQSTVGSGLASPQGVAVDGSGNIYIADADNNRVLKETLSGGVYTESTIGSGLFSPQGIAVDGSGNVYVTDPGNSRVLKEMLSGSAYAESTVGSSLANPFGIAVDGIGNIYIADTNNNRVLMETPSSGAYIESTIASGLNQPYSVTLDGSGNIYIADTNNNRVVEIDVRDPPTLTFPSTDVGSTSMSQTLTLANMGNAPLTFGAPGDVGSLNPSISADFTYSSSSTCSQIGSSSSNFVLAAGTSCTEIVSFAPTAAGTIAGQVVSTDDNLNRAGSMQAVALNGTGRPATPTVTVSNSSTTYGTASATLSATVQFAGIAPTGSLTFTVGPGSPVPATCTAATSTTETCTARYPASTLTVNNYTITGTLAADTNYNMSSGTGTLTVTQATSRLSGPAQQPVTFPYGQGGTFTISVTGQNSGTGVSQPSGTVIYTIGSGATQTAALTNGVATVTVPATQPANSYAVIASYAGDTGYSAAQPITVQLQVIKATATVTLNSLSATYDGNPHAATATTTPSNLNVTFTYNGSATAPTAAGSYAVAGTVNDPNYSGAATATLVISKATATVTLGSLSTTYDGNPHTATATTTPSGLGVTFTYNGSATVPTAAGSYTVVGTISDNNDFGTATGTLVIVKVTAPIGFAMAGHSYGDAPFTVSASSQSTGSITYAVVSGPATVSGSTVTITGGGVITLQATQAATGNYATNTQQASSNVAKAPLTASVIDSTRMYGATNPAFTGTVSGAVHKDTFTESFSVPATTNSAVNTYVITPSVSGAALANYSLTATTGTLTVTQAPVTVTMTSSSTAITPGQTATLTASVASTTSGTPTGSMTFFDNGTALQTVALTNGTASYGATLSQGTTHTITGSYSGDSNFVATSATANGSTTVGVAALDFSFSGSGPATLTVVPGQVVTYTFQVAPTYGAYPGSVTFSVVGLPAGAAATFTPSGLPQNGGTTQVQMTVQLVETMSSNTRGPLGRGTAPVTIAGLLLPLLGLRRRTRNRIELRLMLLPLLIGGALGGVAMTGCGSGVVSIDSAQSYTLVVTTTSSTVQHNQTVTLNVK